jgi:hypothetical protein
MKRFTTTILALVSLIPVQMNSQVTVFQQVYPNSGYDQSSRDIMTTSGGGYLITAMEENATPGDTNIVMVKADHTGDTTWTKTIGGSQPEYAYTTIPTSDGNYFVIGYTLSYGAGGSDSYLIKMNGSGDVLWTKTYGGIGDDEGKDIVPTADGNYVIVGRSESTSLGNHQIYLMKIDLSGAVIWTKYYGGSSYETARSVRECPDGGFIIVGQTLSYGPSNGNIFMVRTNSSGDTIWTKTYGGSNIDDGNAVVANPDGTFIIAAETNSFGAGDFDIQIFKADSNGNMVWNKYYGGDKKDVSKRLEPVSSGGYIVSGISRSFGWVDPQMWLLRINSAGDTLWTRDFGSYNHEHCYSAKPTPDGGFMAVGHSKSYGPTMKIMFVKLDSQGTFGSTAVPELLASETKMYPNPTNGRLNIVFPGNGFKGNIEIKNMLGQVIGRQQISDSPANELTLDMEGEDPGIYMVCFSDGNGIISRKIVKN